MNSGNGAELVSACVIKEPRWLAYTCPECGERTRDDIDAYDAEDVYYGTYEAECPRCGASFRLIVDDWM